MGGRVFITKHSTVALYQSCFHCVLSFLDVLTVLCVSALQMSFPGVEVQKKKKSIPRSLHTDGNFHCFTKQSAPAQHDITVISSGTTALSTLHACMPHAALEQTGIEMMMHNVLTPRSATHEQDWPGCPARPAGKQAYTTSARPRPIGKRSSTSRILSGAGGPIGPACWISGLGTKQAPGDELWKGYGGCLQGPAPAFGRGLRDLFDDCASALGIFVVSRGFWKGLLTSCRFPISFQQVDPHFAHCPGHFSHLHLGLSFRLIFHPGSLSLSPNQRRVTRPSRWTTYLSRRRSVRPSIRPPVLPVMGIKGGGERLQAASLGHQSQLPGSKHL